MDRLEDLRIEWQTHCQDFFAAFLADSGQGLNLREWSGKTLVPECFAWLKERGAWPDSWVENGAVLNRATKQISAALQHLPEMALPTERKALVVPNWSWSISAGIGALTGMLAGTPISLLLTGDRMMGLVLGGIAGAAALPAFVGYLADRPRIRTVIIGSLTAGSALGGIGAIWSTLTGQSRSIPFFRFSLSMLACMAVLYLARPRLVDADDDSAGSSLETYRRLLLAHVADLVLAWVWAHPDRSSSELKATQNPLMPDSFVQAMTDLQCQLIAKSEDPYGKYAEEMIYQFRQLGYEWVFVARGSQFEEAMRAHFTPWGIEPSVGEPVRTIRPGITLRGVSVAKGQLQRIKN